MLDIQKVTLQGSYSVPAEPALVFYCNVIVKSLRTERVLPFSPSYCQWYWIKCFLIIGGSLDGGPGEIRM